MTKLSTIHPSSDNNNIINDLLSNNCFNNHIKQYDHLPWLQSIKEKAWKEFHDLPLPKRTDEKWRFSDLKKLSLEGYQFPHAKIGYERVDIFKHSSIVTDYAGRMIFEDNHLLKHDYISDHLLNKGLIWEPLAEAFENHPKLIQKYFAQQKTHLGSEKFHYLNLAYTHSGSFLYIPKDTIIDDPLIVYHWAQEDQVALLPQTIIVAEPGAKVTLIDIYSSHNQKHNALTISIGSIFAEQNAQVHRITIQTWSPVTLSFQLDNTQAQEAATIKTLAINLGSSLARFENQVVLNGPHAQADLYSLTIADNSQEFDQRSFQEHNAPHTVSNLLYKNALMDEAHTVFSGMIKVHPIADKTDAYQTNRNLLLSDSAVASSLPGLEIEANDVKCSHGATSSKLDSSELFYMISRGISKDRAQQLLVFAFLEDILQKIENEPLYDNLNSIIEQKLNKTLTTNQ